MYLSKNTVKKSYGLYAGCLILILSLLVRVKIHLFGGTDITVEMMMFCVMFFLALSFVRVLTTKKLEYNQLINTAGLFWIWSCISTLISMVDVSRFIYNIASQSFWYIFALFFVLYFTSTRANEVSFVIKFCAVVMIAAACVYIYWILNGDNIHSSGAINSVYYCLPLLPIVFVLRKRTAVVVSIMLVFSAVLMSGKRAGLIAFILALLIPLLLDDNKRKNKIHNITTVFIIVGVIFLTYYLVANVVEIKIFERLKALSTDEGSGRIMIYSRVFEAYQESSLFHQIFGHGFNGVAANGITAGVEGIMSTSAHNDFLEVLYDYGIVGFILYIAMFVKMFKIAFVIKKKNNKFFKTYISALIIFITMSLFSHLIIYPTYIAFLLIYILWGSIIAEKGENDGNHLVLGSFI